MLHCFMADPFTISFLMKMITDRVDMMLTRGLTLDVLRPPRAGCWLT